MHEDRDARDGGELALHRTQFAPVAHVDARREVELAHAVDVLGRHDDLPHALSGEHLRQLAEPAEPEDGLHQHGAAQQPLDAAGVLLGRGAEDVGQYVAEYHGAFAYTQQS